MTPRDDLHGDYLWRGDACTACQDDRRAAEARGDTKLPHVQSARDGDWLCARHFMTASPAVRAVIALGMPAGPVPFLGVVDWESPVLDEWLGGKAA
jgi:hypothetical protein